MTWTSTTLAAARDLAELGSEDPTDAGPYLPTDEDCDCGGDCAACGELLAMWAAAEAEPARDLDAPAA